MLLNSNISQESITQVLTGLKSQIGRVESALQARNDAEPPSSDIGEDSERISRNLRLFVRAAESFHSSASTIIADEAGSTVWGGSVMGDPLSDEQHRNIQDWIPPPIIEKEDRTQQESQPSGQIAQSSDVPLNGTGEDSEQDSEADSDMERDMLKRFQDLAINNFSKGDYPKAERFLVKVIDRSARGDPSEDITKMKLMQAYTYGYQGNWNDSERVLLGLAALKGAANPMAFYGLHALALRKLDMGAYDNAIRYCKRALMGRRRIEGKDGAQFYEPMALLAHIYEAKGDSAEAEGCRSFLPAGYSAPVQLPPLEYLTKPLTQYFPHTSTSHQNPPKKPHGEMAVEYTKVITTGTHGAHSLPQDFASVPAQDTKPNPIIHGSPQYSQRRYTPILSPTPPEKRLSPQTSLDPQPGTPLPLAGSQQHGHNSLHVSQHLANRATALAQPYNFPQAQDSPLAPQIQPEKARKSRIIVAVDFGTTESAVAYAFSNGMDSKEDIVTVWPSSYSGTMSKTKVPTVLYYNLTEEVAGWGYDVGEALVPTGYLKPGFQKVEWFKLQLMLEGNSYIDQISLPPLPAGKSAVDVAADYLFKLRQAIHNYLNMNLGDVFIREERYIQYCFSVPAIWNGTGKAALRQAIIQAGFISSVDNRRLSLIAEPEAMAIYCATAGAVKLSLNDAILVIDCGPETVDLIAYEAVKEHPIQLTELTSGSSDSCGSTALNRNFSNLLRAKIKRTRLSSGSKTAGKIYAKAIMEFDNRIKYEFRNNGQKWAVDVGIEAEIPEADIKEGYMVWTNEEILQCFEPVVNRILELTQNQIIAVQAIGRQLKNILVVGRFSSNEYMFQQIRLHVPAHFHTAVVRPLDSEMAVVKGLVTAGIFSHTFHASKKARRGYYIPIPEVYVPNLHPSQYIFVGLDGLSYCQNSITTIINKGQVLGPDELFRIKITKLVIPGDALEFEDSLWTSDDEMPPGQKVYSNCHPGSLPPRRFHLYSETREQRQMPAFTELAKITYQF